MTESCLSWPTLESLITESSEPPRWLVTDLFYQGSLICLAGVPGVGKSVFSYSLAISVATGTPFLGLQSSRGRVLYFDEENGPSNMPTYFRWAWRGSDCPDLSTLGINFRLGQHAILKHSGAWAECVLDQVRDYRPNLIVFDTAISCFRIQNENDNSEAANIIGKLRLIQAASDANTTILVLRHAILLHDQNSGEVHYKQRGATNWLSQSDSNIFHIAPPGRPPASGLRPTYLIPDKTRAYGLRSKLTITPSWTSDHAEQRGLKLSGHLD